jgi:hypothetical protein
MASFESVNYAIRPNKNIERKLIFEALRLLDGSIPLRGYRYVGLGSLWFVDFILAHRYLSISDMVCIEYETNAERVEFNRPYECIEVRRGITTDVLPSIDLESQPSLIWLDYDTGSEGPILQDIELIASSAKVGTITLVTVNALRDRLPELDADGRKLEKEAALRLTFGSLVPATLPHGALTRDGYPILLAQMLLAHMDNCIHRSGHGNKFLPIFNFYYRDGAPMVTVGGIIVDGLHEHNYLKSGVDVLSWVTSGEQITIQAPPLTVKEKFTFDRLLPRANSPTAVELGFPLSEEHIAAYHRYYRHYPLFGEFQV